jgi:DNA-binding transcriptional MerR regulator
MTPSPRFYGAAPDPGRHLAALDPVPRSGPYPAGVATYTIGQLADRAGVNLETLRYYERKGLLPEPPRTEAGYRQYGPDALARLEFISRAKGLGFTLAEIAGLLTEHEAGGPADGVLLVAREKIKALDEQQRELAATRSRLELLVAVCADPDSPECLDLRVGGCAAG